MNAYSGVRYTRKQRKIMQQDSEGGAILVTEMMVITFIETLI